MIADGAAAVNAGLPSDLRAAIGRLLEDRPRSALVAKAARLSEIYRAGGNSREAITDETGALTYALARMPATYAAVAAVLAEAARRAPDFSPRTSLDAGAGPGTASWACAERYPTLASISMMDASPAFIDLARRLARDSVHPALRASTSALGDFVRGDAPLPESDLAIAAYVLAELADSACEEVAARLWMACAGLFVLVEPGTPAGHKRIMTARERLIAEGAAVLAPCPHAHVCPLRMPDWCHFAARLPRSRDHMLAKTATVPFEDEKFSYLVVARPHVIGARAGGRVLAPPRRNKAGLTLRLCRADGIADVAVARRDRAAFARLRHARWGDGY